MYNMLVNHRLTETDDNTKLRVLVTGAFGWKAKPILKALHQYGAEVVSFDLPAILGYSAHVDLLSDAVVFGSVVDYDAVDQVMAGMDVVVHIAAINEDQYTTPDGPFDTNVQGTYNVFETARQHDVKKVIVISQSPPPCADDVSVFAKTVRPDSHRYVYQLTRRLQETVAEDFSKTFGMDVVVLRAGYVVDSRDNADPFGRRLKDVKHLRGNWVCRHDLAKVVLKALDFDSPGFHIYDVVGSQDARAALNVERTERELDLTISARFEKFPA